MIIFFRTSGDQASKVLKSLQFCYILICDICPNIGAVYILLKTKACITVNNVFLSKKRFTRLICARHAIRFRHFSRYMDIKC